ncbi:hypothetical protein A2U01_0073958, partial [Trifolium medium]|nr:hypothetical protein [Trifolium medium]
MLQDARNGPKIKVLRCGFRVQGQGLNQDEDEDEDGDGD